MSLMNGFNDELEKIASGKTKALSAAKKALIGGATAIPIIAGGAKINQMENKKIRKKNLQTGYEIGRRHEQVLSRAHRGY